MRPCIGDVGPLMGGACPPSSDRPNKVMSQVEGDSSSERPAAGRGVSLEIQNDGRASEQPSPCCFVNGIYRIQTISTQASPETVEPFDGIKTEVLGVAALAVPVSCSSMGTSTVMHSTRTPNAPRWQSPSSPFDSGKRSRRWRIGADRSSKRTGGCPERRLCGVCRDWGNAISNATSPQAGSRLPSVFLLWPGRSTQSGKIEPDDGVSGSESNLCDRPVIAEMIHRSPSISSECSATYSSSVGSGD